MATEKSFWGIAGPLRHCGARGSLPPLPPSLDGPGLLFKFWTLRNLSPLWGLRDNVRCSFWAQWKARSGLRNSVNWTFSLGVTAEALRAKIDRKSAILLQRGQFDPKLQVKGVAPTNHFGTDSKANECHTTLSLTVFTQRNFVPDFLQAKCDFRLNMAVLRLWAPLGT